MKAYLLDWHNRCKNLPSWFVSRTEVENLSLEQIKELYATGNNVMLIHAANEDGIDIVAVDIGRFGMR